MEDKRASFIFGFVMLAVWAGFLFFLLFILSTWPPEAEAETIDCLAENHWHRD